MNKNLYENGYIEVKNFIDESQLKKLNEALNDQTQDLPVMNSDRNVAVNFKVVRNFLPFVALQSKLISKVSDIIEEDVIPTYNYTRKYMNGAWLKTHSDKPTCEISISLNLDSDKQWGFCIQKPTYTGSNKFTTIMQNPGDAVIYLGVDSFHWRDGKFEGTYYSQSFMHYVCSNGRYAHYFYDLQTERIAKEIETQKLNMNR